MQLTKKHVDYFNKQVIKWANKLDLHDYKIKICNKKRHTQFKNAFCQCEPRNGVATITLLTEDYLADEDIYKDLENTALHELVHIILAKLQTMKYNVFMSEEEYINELEYVTRKITRLLL